MEISYWESRWRKNNIGFHLPRVYEPLIEFWGESELPENPVVLVPLSGKSHDILWMMNQGARVIAVEAVEQAVAEFFTEHNITPDKSKRHGFTICRYKTLEIWIGDFFKLPAGEMPPFDLIYDKAAITALPEKMRGDYVEKIKSLVNTTTQIVTHHFEYNQHEMTGPPFSVPLSELNSYYSGMFKCKILVESNTSGNYRKFIRRGLSSDLTERFTLFLPNSFV
jgi:thiopurine S-methyltransferase